MYIIISSVLIAEVNYLIEVLVKVNLTPRPMLSLIPRPVLSLIPSPVLSPIPSPVLSLIPRPVLSLISRPIMATNNCKIFPTPTWNQLSGAMICGTK